MAEHELKTKAPFWDAVFDGKKTFEVRRDDRGFQRGDTLILRRWDSEYDWPTHPPAVIRKIIAYILTGGQFGIEPGYVVMGLQDEIPKE